MGRPGRYAHKAGMQMPPANPEPSDLVKRLMRYRARLASQHRRHDVARLDRAIADAIAAEQGGASMV